MKAKWKIRRTCSSQMVISRIKYRFWEIRLKSKLINWSSNRALRMSAHWLISKRTRMMSSKYWMRWRNPFNSWAANLKMRAARRGCLTTFWKSKSSSMKTCVRWTAWRSLCGMVVSRLDLCSTQWIMNRRRRFLSRALPWRGILLSARLVQLPFQSRMAKSLWAMENLSASDGPKKQSTPAPRASSSLGKKMKLAASCSHSPASIRLHSFFSFRRVVRDPKFKSSWMTDRFWAQLNRIKISFSIKILKSKCISAVSSTPISCARRWACRSAQEAKPPLTRPKHLTDLHPHLELQASHQAKEARPTAASSLPRSKLENKT